MYDIIHSVCRGTYDIAKTDIRLYKTVRLRYNINKELLRYAGRPRVSCQAGLSSDPLKFRSQHRRDIMFWDKISPLYDLFETVYNNRVYNNTGKAVAQFISSSDDVLECACGTGAITKYIAPKCRTLVATDMARGMLRQTRKKCRSFDNVKLRRADIMNLKCRNDRFDKVVAGNVIHLLDDPKAALHELERVCKPGGRLLIPTYINDEGTQQRKAVMLLEKLGVDFKREFNIKTYKEFFASMGYSDVEYIVVDGRMPCAIAVIKV